jgi:hypothetical protein
MKAIRDELPNKASPRDHLDEVRLIVRLSGTPVPSPGSTAGGLYCIWGGPLAVSLEDAARYASAVAWDEEKELFEPFVSNQRYTQFEWGASGTALEFAIELVQVVAVESILLGMGYAIGKIRGRQSSNDRYCEVLRTTEGLSSDVLAATAPIFAVGRDDLKVPKVEADRREATVVVKGNGSQLHASIKRLDTGDPVVVVKRRD